MYSTTKKLTTLAIVIGLAALLSACNSETSGSTSSSGGSSGESSAPRDQFNLIFQQTIQPCPDCSLFFDSARLVIEYSGGTYSYEQKGSLHIRKNANAAGSFKADLSSIPIDADIISATLYMRLNADEGLANSDYSSVAEVFSNDGGQLTFLRYITAKDIKARGYSKTNPVVPFDFTSYAQQL